MEQQSLLSFYWHALGLKYAIALSGATIFSMLGVMIVIVRGRGPFVAPGMIFLAALPLLVGLGGTFDGLIDSLQVIASSPLQPKPSQLAEGYSMALVTTMFGSSATMLVSVVAAIGSFVRSLTAKE